MSHIDIGLSDRLNNNEILAQLGFDDIEVSCVVTDDIRVDNVWSGDRVDWMKSIGEATFTLLDTLVELLGTSARSATGVCKAIILSLKLHMQAMNFIQS